MDARHKFSKENPFLKEYYSNRAIYPKKKGIVFPIQGNLFGENSLKKEGLKGKLGYFYELLTSNLYGGRIKERQHNGCLDSFAHAHTIEPDVTSKKFFRESKGVHYSEYLKLSDFQMAKYAYMNFNSKKKQLNSIFTVME